MQSLEYVPNFDNDAAKIVCKNVLKSISDQLLVSADICYSISINKQPIRSAVGIRRYLLLNIY